MTTPASFPQCRATILFQEEYRGRYGYETTTKTLAGTCADVFQKISSRMDPHNPYVRILPGSRVEVQFVPEKKEIYAIKPSILSYLALDLSGLSPEFQPVARDFLNSFNYTSLGSIKDAFQRVNGYAKAHKVERIALPLCLRGLPIFGLCIRREDNERINP